LVRVRVGNMSRVVVNIKEAAPSVRLT